MKYTVEQAEKLIAATNEAGKRSRQLAYFIGLFTVFAFVILWDSGQDGWVRQRHERLSALEAEYDRFVVGRAAPDSTIWKDFTEKNDSIDEAFFDSRPFLKSGEQLRAYKKMHDDLMKEALVVEAPILGVTFDINNFPLFYGLSFLLLMAIMAVNLKRELQFQTFTISVVAQFKGTDFQYLYHLFAMGQVLTSPEAPSKIQLSIWNRLAKLSLLQNIIYLLPSLMMFAIVIYDCCTIRRRVTIDPKLGYIQLCIEVIVFVLMAFLSWRCYRQGGEINQKWIALNNEFPSLEAPEDGNANDPEPTLPSPPAASHIGGADNLGTPPPANAEGERPKRKRGGK